MIDLDQQEQVALKEFLLLLEEQSFHPQLTMLQNRMFRTADGQIIIPVLVRGTTPLVSLALLMGHKADQIYKEMNCRFLLAQVLMEDPRQQLYVWEGNKWKPLS